MDGNGDLLLARATVHLSGLAVGETALVDPRDPYIAELLESSLLVPLDIGEPHGTPVQESQDAVAAPPQDETGG